MDFVGHQLPNKGLKTGGKSLPNNTPISFGGASERRDVPFKGRVNEIKIHHTMGSGQTPRCMDERKEAFGIKLIYCCSPESQIHLFPLKQDISFHQQEESKAAPLSGDEIRLWNKLDPQQHDDVFWWGVETVRTKAERQWLFTSHGAKQCCYCLETATTWLHSDNIPPQDLWIQSPNVQYYYFFFFTLFILLFFHMNVLWEDR